MEIMIPIHKYSASIDWNMETIFVHIHVCALYAYAYKLETLGHRTYMHIYVYIAHAYSIYACSPSVLPCHCTSKIELSSCRELSWMYLRWLPSILPNDSVFDIVFQRYRLVKCVAFCFMCACVLLRYC